MSVQGVYVRWQRDEPRIGRQLPPLAADHPLSTYDCVACGEQLGNGAPVTIIVLGPGPDLEDREKCARGGWISASGVTVHWACATGE